MKRAARANRLALIRAFCAAVRPSTCPRRRPVHNFFAVVNPPMPTAIVPAKTRTNGKRCARAQRNPAKRDVAKTRVSSALLQRAKFFVRNYFGEEFFVRAFRRRSRRGRGRERGAALTHNIKRSHCYFFPAVVIGWQCSSIRDCTAPMSPSTQARRAAMAKKRKTKAAEKKTAKKTTKRRKKK